MLHEMGIETGIDLDALLEAARAARDVLGRPLGSHTLVAGAVDWQGGPDEPLDDLLAQARRRLARVDPDAARTAMRRRRRAGRHPRREPARARRRRARAACSSRATCSSGAATRTARTATSAWPTPGAALIVMCDAGFQSSLAAATLQELGHAEATDLDGGFQAWRAAGLPVEPLDPDDRTSV